MHTLMVGGLAGLATAGAPPVVWRKMLIEEEERVVLNSCAILQQYTAPCGLKKLRISCANWRVGVAS